MPIGTKTGGFASPPYGVYTTRLLITTPTKGNCVTELANAESIAFLEAPDLQRPRYRLKRDHRGVDRIWRALSPATSARASYGDHGRPLSFAQSLTICGASSLCLPALINTVESASPCRAEHSSIVVCPSVGVFSVPAFALLGHRAAQYL